MDNESLYKIILYKLLSRNLYQIITMYNEEDDVMDIEPILTDRGSHLMF